MSRRKLRLQRSGPWIGVAGMFIVLWYAITSVLYAPWWGVVLSLALLIPSSMLLARWARSRPAWCVTVPVIGAALNGALAYVGATYWGWSS